MRKLIDLITEASFEDIDYEEVNRLAERLGELLNQNGMLDYDDLHACAEGIVSQNLINQEAGQIMTPDLVLNQLFELRPMDNSNIDEALLNSVAAQIAERYS